MANAYDLDWSPLAGGNVVALMADGDSGVDYDAGTDTTQIPLENGLIEISFGPPPKARKETENFDDNLAEVMADEDLSRIAERLLTGIEQDLQSRSEWFQNMKEGISLLGLQIKMPRAAAAQQGSPAEGTSTVDHPLLLEACLRFQANAVGELLPTDGPVKVRNDGEGNAMADALAEALEKDLNHYLTKVAKEYVPDTDRMLLLLGFSGISFKKGYHDPIKRRPVIASIDSNDLIVSNTTTDLDSAGRVTHRIMMRPSTMKRMQLVGAYRDVNLPATGMPTTYDPVDTKILQTQGIAPLMAVEPEDQEREVYECYCEYDIPGFEHMRDTDDGQKKPTGLPLPYKVTIDREARQVLEIRRNWEEEDPFCLARNRIIAYTFVPGFGFYGIGLLNILGNATKAVTAAWRLMLDAGMFANFPGFLYLKSLAKQLTNQFRIPPAGGMPIDAVGNDIRSVIMPLPYKDPSAVFIQLIENIATTAQRVGGTAELQIGEGKQDAPVGTTLALIEQATKLMSAVHKRLHVAQGAEFDMLKELLKEDPEALWRHNKKSKVLKILTGMAGQQPLVDAEQAAEDRHRALFLAALTDCELIPRADPNTSSQTERYLKAVALRQLAQSNQGIDLNKVDQRVLRIMGIDDGDSLFKPAPPPGAQMPPSPEEVMAQATAKTADARLLDSQTKAKTAASQAANATATLASKEKIASLNLAREITIHQADQDRIAADRNTDVRQRAADRLHEMALASLDNHRSTQEGIANRTHQAAQSGLDRQHKATEMSRDRFHDLMTQPPPPTEQPQGVAP